MLVQHNKMFPLKSATNLAYVALGNQNDNGFLNALRQYADVRQLSAYTAMDIHSNETLVVGIYADTATPWKKQFLSIETLELLNKLVASHDVHLLVFAKPYVLRQLSNFNSYSSVLLAHQQETAFINAAARILFGKIEAVGKLPVTLEAFD